MPRSRSIAAFTCALMLGACSFVPDYERPAVSTPAAFEGPQSAYGAITVAADWWTSFGDSELQSLMSEALANNLDIAAALARIDEAQGQLRATDASLLPQVEASGDASRSYGSGSNGGKKSASGSLSISYAVDLWGLYRAQSESSEASFNASRFDHDATVLLVQSSVATTYFNILNLKDRLAIARESLAAAQETLTLVEARFTHGADSALDLAQQKAAVASIQAGIPSLENQLAANQHALAILLGRAPEGFAVKTATGGALKLPAIAAGQPSSLLERRPDIRRAEAQLQSANADIGAARAAFFPNLSLSAGKTVDWIAGAGTTNGSSIAASVLAPIFSGGELEGNLQTSKAKKVELAADYRKAVLTAFGEVEDALVGADANARQAASQGVAAEESRKAYDLSQQSYKAGAVDFVTVLDAERSWLSARDAEAQARLAQYTAAVNLFIALGGGWTS
ncbi:MAG TPA: efflux transporter outer membrane subunit [Parvibaculum sp.]